MRKSEKPDWEHHVVHPEFKIPDRDLEFAPSISKSPLEVSSFITQKPNSSYKSSDHVVRASLSLFLQTHAGLKGMWPTSYCSEQ